MDFAGGTNIFDISEEQAMKKDSLVQSALNRRQLLKGAVSTAAVVSASPFIGTPYAESRQEGLRPRIRESFDYDWQFSRGDFPNAHLADFSDSDWRAVDLPHDWSVEGPFDENESSGFCGGYLPTGIGWYRKCFRVP